jgi:hypothetical protein
VFISALRSLVLILSKDERMGSWFDKLTTSVSRLVVRQAHHERFGLAARRAHHERFV